MSVDGEDPVVPTKARAWHFEWPLPNLYDMRSGFPEVGTRDESLAVGLSLSDSIVMCAISCVASKH